MKMLKNYYATAQCFVRTQTGSVTDPRNHRYILLRGFDENTVRLVNEATLCGIWPLMNGKMDLLDFFRRSVSNGRELSEISEYTGQVYKRTPARKTFIIDLNDFLLKNAISEEQLESLQQQLKYGT